DTDQIFLKIGTGGAALQGGGKVTLTDSNKNIIEGTAAANTLLNVDNTISGAGNIGNGQMTLIHAAKGVINANGTHFLVIDTGSNVIRNAGTMAATAAGGLDVQSPIINTGTLKAAAGAIVQTDGPLTNSGQLIAAPGGTLAIENTITGFGR